MTKKIIISSSIRNDLYDWLISQCNGNQTAFIEKILEEAKGDNIDAINSKIEKSKIDLMVLEIKRDQLLENLQKISIEGNQMERTMASAKIEIENQKRKERLNRLLPIYNNLKNLKLFEELNVYVFHNGFINSEMTNYIYKFAKQDIKINHAELREIIINKDYLENLNQEYLKFETKRAVQDIEN